MLHKVHNLLQLKCLQKISLLKKMAQIEKSIAKNTQNTTSPRELAWPKWKSINNVYLRPIHPSDNKVTMGHNNIFDTPSLIKFIQDVLVGHIQDFFQILKSLFTLDPAIIMQSVPSDLLCFLNGPLQIVKNQIHMLTTCNLQKTDPQKELDATKLFKCSAHRLVKETLHH